MNRISNTMLRIGMILCIICGAILLFCMPFLITMGVSPHIHEMIAEAVRNGDVNSDYAPDVAAGVFQGIMLGYGIFCLIYGALCVAAAVVSSKTLREPSRGRYIACIVMGCMSTGFSVAGGILGLIYQARVARNERRQKVIDAEQEYLEFKSGQ